MATGYIDANGIWNYGEDDSDSTFSELLNRLATSTSAVVQDPTVSGKMRLTNLNDVSLVSTNHAFQIGNSSGDNIRMDTNEIMAVSNGVAAQLLLNSDGGQCVIGPGGLTTTGSVTAATGAVTSLTGRLTSTADVSLSSTTHAFQIGPSTAANIRMDQNEIMCVNNGAIATLAIQADGGDVSLGNTASDVTIPGRINATNYSWAQSAGSVTTSASANVTVTLPASRFTVAPIINVTNATGANAVCMPYVASAAAGSFTLSLYTTAGARVAQLCHWTAVQMTSTTAAG